MVEQYLLNLGPLGAAIVVLIIVFIKEYFRHLERKKVDKEVVVVNPTLGGGGNSKKLNSNGASYSMLHLLKDINSSVIELKETHRHVGDAITNSKTALETAQRIEAALQEHRRDFAQTLTRQVTLLEQLVKESSKQTHILEEINLRGRED